MCVCVEMSVCVYVCVCVCTVSPSPSPSTAEMYVSAPCLYYIWIKFFLFFLSMCCFFLSVQNSTILFESCFELCCAIETRGLFSIIYSWCGVWDYFLIVQSFWCICINNFEIKVLLTLAMFDPEENHHFSVTQPQKTIILNGHGEKLVGLLHDTGSREVVVLCHGFRSSKVVD